jgi:transcriptional regulator with XRE-family HTH domain
MACVRTTAYESVEQALLTTEVKWNLIEKIKEVRQEKGISQDELAKRVGVSHATISKIESRHQIGLDTLILIYEALDLDFNLLEETKKAKKKLGLKLPSEVEHRHTGKYNPNRKEDTNG